VWYTIIRKKQNNRISEREVKVMKVLHIWVGYGKNERFVDSKYVEEEALENYKNEIISSHRKNGWMKEFVFIENSEPMTKWDGKGNYGTILCRTTKGYEYNYKVNL
jgi:hypothetical protein